MSRLRPFVSRGPSDGIQVVPRVSPESDALAALIRAAVPLTPFPVISAQPGPRADRRLLRDLGAGSS